MKKNTQPTLIAIIITIILLIGIISITILVKKQTDSKNSPLETEEEKIKSANYDLTLITPKDVFKTIGKEEFMIIDTRSSDEFKENHIESSINIPLGNLVKTNSTLRKDKTLVIIEKEETIEGKKAASKLKKSDFTLNYLQGGLLAYLEAGYDLVSYGDVNSIQDRAKVNLIDLKELGGKLNNGERFIYLDVRNKSDFNNDHFQNAINIPLEELEKRKGEIPTGKITVIDQDTTRSFRAAVRLHDMNILTVYYLINTYSEFKEAVKNKTLLGE